MHIYICIYIYIVLIVHTEVSYLAVLVMYVCMFVCFVYIIDITAFLTYWYNNIILSFDIWWVPPVYLEHSYKGNLTFPAKSQ